MPMSSLPRPGSPPAARLSLATEPAPPRSIEDCIEVRTIHGYRRAFVHAGRGPAVLLIHGIGDRSDTWRDVIADLAADHTVIAPDLLGHGRSDKPRADYSVAGFANGMRDLLEVLSIDRATVIGHSLGGGIAMQLAYQYPERVERLVLVSPGGVGHHVHPVLRLVSGALAELALPLLRWPGARGLGHCLFDALVRLDTDLGVDAAELRRLFDALPDAASARAFSRTLRSAVDWQGQAMTMLDRCYLASDVPTLLMWGTRDGVLPYAHAALAQRAMPSCRLEVFDGAGHFPHRHQPARFLSVVRDFLASTEPARHDAAAWRARIQGQPPPPHLHRSPARR
jgi:pimeloyl-ACP methyl ester carboxylesterase